MTERKGDVVLVNPVIIARSTEEDLKEEGCLSFPLIYGHVKRSKWIEVSYQDIRGTKLGKKFEGLEARVFQHEFDHLDKVHRPAHPIVMCTCPVTKSLGL